MLLTSGDWHVDQKKIITEEVYLFMCKKYPQLNDVTVEVNQVDLTDEYCLGFCQVDEYGEFFIHIQRSSTYRVC